MPQEYCKYKSSKAEACSKAANTSYYFPFDIRYPQTFKDWARSNVTGGGGKEWFQSYPPTIWEEQREGYNLFTRKHRETELLYDDVTGMLDKVFDIVDLLSNPKTMWEFLSTNGLKDVIMQAAREMQPGNFPPRRETLQRIQQLLNDPNANFIQISLSKWVENCIAQDQSGNPDVGALQRELGAIFDSIVLPSPQQIIQGVNDSVEQNNISRVNANAEINERMSARTQLDRWISGLLNLLNYPRRARRN